LKFQNLRHHPSRIQDDSEEEANITAVPEYVLIAKANLDESQEVPPDKRKRGRPAGSKNKPKGPDSKSRLDPPLEPSPEPTKSQLTMKHRKNRRKAVVQKVQKAFALHGLVDDDDDDDIDDQSEYLSQKLPKYQPKKQKSTLANIPKMMSIPEEEGRDEMHEMHEENVSDSDEEQNHVIRQPTHKVSLLSRIY
jgi:hypothetical protein